MLDMQMTVIGRLMLSVDSGSMHGWHPAPVVVWLIKKRKQAVASPYQSLPPEGGGNSLLPGSCRHLHGGYKAVTR